MRTLNSTETAFHLDRYELQLSLRSDYYEKRLSLTDLRVPLLRLSAEKEDLVRRAKLLTTSADFETRASKAVVDSQTAVCMRAVASVSESYKRRISREKTHARTCEVSPSYLSFSILSFSRPTDWINEHSSDSSHSLSQASCRLLDSPFECSLVD
jgi:hypothetical protein